MVAVTMSLPTLGSVLLGLALLYFAKSVLLRKKTSAPLPPGPKPKPIIGNLRDLPRPGQQEWVHWLKFKELYGPISSVSMFGQTIIILNDHQVAVDLMEKRSATYSSRPRMVFAGEIVGWEDVLGFQGYSDRFRFYRKVLHRVLGTKALMSRFNPLQDVEVRRFLLRVLRKPDDLIQHIRTEAGAVILKIAYGYNIEPNGPDPLVDLANEAMENFSVAGNPGTWLVDTIPLLRYLPAWFPGAGFKQTGYAWRKTLLTTIEKPYQLVKQQIRQGSYSPSYLASALEQSEGKPTAEEEFASKWTAASLYLGGADTTVSSLSCFFLAMALYPEVQRKAQEEIDRVIGPNKLPTFDDREKLPYIEAVVKETLRWHPVGPMGIPHLVTEDDVEFHPIYSTSDRCRWFTHDPTIYRDPETFRPERFLGDNPELDPHSLVFGYGRRICPGQFLADATVFLSTAQSLTVFNFSKPEGEDLQAEFLPGVISHPAPYSLDITPRSAAHEALIRSVEVEHPWEESHAKELEKVGC
ncbi:O-methylsterigmatocystin oxidoreductase [Aspergillus nomiae NRRL 13137]|uniref:O-methylsterigmatocystin oxidoreductase n=1 Tax=Aspergillus nomiae NRRL (strain ATCC 15546 / NRRL 13137 / CBS 260.88 / M93) TaxID=1509407 RepID=A0A0L1ITQ3_ASPN3|nr:O-methylsterigmatocystin oxidoreductase [Aspergillus nomiae NRRL 13137]KNG82926.1 O-methylsterigmatocystin oxidoreductase [Aspergillus nomiae NRRL 13137]